MRRLKLFFSSFISKLIISMIALSMFGCLTEAEDVLPPLEEEYSVDGGMYQPEKPSETSGYGSGASGVSGEAETSGASGSGATKEAGHHDQQKYHDFDQLRDEYFGGNMREGEFQWIEGDASRTTPHMIRSVERYAPQEIHVSDLASVETER